MRTARCALLAVLSLFISTSVVGKTSSFRHDDYGFEVRKPAGAMRCASDENAVNDGEMFYLDKTEINCRTVDYHVERTISINGVPSGNSDSGGPDTLDGYYQEYCALSDGCTGDHPGLSIVGQKVLTGEVAGKDGRIEIFVLYQHGLNRNSKDKSRKANNIAVVLSTDEAHQARDVEVLKQLLATLRIYDESR